MHLNVFQRLDEWMRAASSVLAAQLQPLSAIATPAGRIVSEISSVTAEARMLFELIFQHRLEKSWALGGWPPYSRGLLRFTAEVLLCGPWGLKESYCSWGLSEKELWASHRLPCLPPEPQVPATLQPPGAVLWCQDLFLTFVCSWPCLCSGTQNPVRHKEIFTLC